MWSCVLQRTIPPDLACPWPVLQDDVKIQRNKNSITDKPEGQESKWGSWVTCSKYWRLLRPEEGKSFFTIFSPFLWPCLLVSSLPLLSDSRETLQLFQDFRVRWRVFFSSPFQQKFRKETRQHKADPPQAAPLSEAPAPEQPCHPRRHREPALRPALPPPTRSPARFCCATLSPTTPTCLGEFKYYFLWGRMVSVLLTSPREGGLIFHYKPYSPPTLTRTFYFMTRGPITPEKNLLIEG